jgi:DNA-binding MarR family transcriptional regulator
MTMHGRATQGGPADQVATLKNALKALKPFIDLRDTMPLQYVRAFLLVATEEGLNVSEYAKRAGTSQSLMTRHLADLGEINRYHEEGFGLVEQYSNVMDKRDRLMRLTTKGKHIARVMCDALG